MTIICDIDNTICKTEGNDYANAVPIPENIAKINKLYDEGAIIIYHTSRGNSTGINWYELTLKQLNEWGCKFNSLWLNKPSYDLWIDDKAKRIEEL
jgi:hypothetical protein